MKILADENIEYELVAWLRDGGHDVVWAAETAASTADSFLLDIAHAEQRIILTSDLDFGELIFRYHRPAHGVVLLRFGLLDELGRLTLLQSHWPTIERQAVGHFIVADDRRLRVRPL
jgi:predicted nuclease of predicted toxin-antitoxin system